MAIFRLDNVDEEEESGSVEVGVVIPASALVMLHPNLWGCPMSHPAPLILVITCHRHDKKINILGCRLFPFYKLETL